MAQSLDRLKETPSQTAGPFVHIGLTPNFVGIGGVYGQDLGSTMVNERTRGERISLVVTVFDGAGAPLRDALVEIWQADAEGFYASPAEARGRADPDFTGWGRSAAVSGAKPSSAAAIAALAAVGIIPSLASAEANARSNSSIAFSSAATENQAATSPSPRSPASSG